MRSSKVKELPAADSDEAAEVVKVIGQELSLICSAMKKEVLLFSHFHCLHLVDDFTQIADSLEPGAETRNLAVLTNSLLLHAPWVNPTLRLYYRIAYIVSISFCMTVYYSSPFSDDMSAPNIPSMTSGQMVSTRSRKRLTMRALKIS